MSGWIRWAFGGAVFGVAIFLYAGLLNGCARETRTFPDPVPKTTRIEVPGGWLYITTVHVQGHAGTWGTAAVSTTFVYDMERSTVPSVIPPPGWEPRPPVEIPSLKDWKPEPLPGGYGDVPLIPPGLVPPAPEKSPEPEQPR